MTDRTRNANTTFSVTGPAVESGLQALGASHPFAVLLFDKAERATGKAKDPAKNTPMGRVMRHLQALARGINGTEGHPHGSHYTCQRVWAEMSEALAQPGADPVKIYASIRERSGIGTKASRGGLGGGYSSDFDPRKG